jgi:Asp-tRNA(Asn)/Glu-tRNA(Gln) amidotransferase A subunit family amidase
MNYNAGLTATQALQRLRAGTLDPVALMEACLERIAEREPDVRAFAWFDADAARAAARAAPAGPLQGLPLGVKDVLDTADMPTAHGSPIYAGWRPRADAAAVAAARAAGAVVIGKTVTTEFATRTSGPTVNPHAPPSRPHTPGGSSSGSAAGVGAGMFPLAYGTQTAGSIVRPAAFCGVVGYKPSFGLISRAGMKVMSDSLDTIGVMARAVADCALLAGAVSGRDLGDPDTLPDRAPVVGLCRSPAWPHAAPETQALLAEVAARLGRAGARIVERELPAACAELEAAQPIVMNGESARAMAWELATARAQISEGLRDRLDWGLRQTPQARDAAAAAFETARAAYADATADLDILLTPSTIGEAPAGIESTGDPVFNAIWTALHVPCVTVPAGTGPNGLPLGIQIVGKRGADRAALAWAQYVAAAIG